jgi:hypothetical protein
MTRTCTHTDASQNTYADCARARARTCANAGAKHRLGRRWCSLVGGARASPAPEPCLGLAGQVILESFVVSCRVSRVRHRCQQSWRREGGQAADSECARLELCGPPAHSHAHMRECAGEDGRTFAHACGHKSPHACASKAHAHGCAWDTPHQRAVMRTHSSRSRRAEAWQRGDAVALRRGGTAARSGALAVVQCHQPGGGSSERRHRADRGG